MSSGMNVEQAKEYAKTMTYSEAVSNVKRSKGIKYRKATMIKLRELTEIADRFDKANTLQTEREGEWIYPSDVSGFGRCENCNALWSKDLIDNIFFIHCPRCGAKMRGSDKEKVSDD